MNDMIAIVHEQKDGKIVFYGWGENESCVSLNVFWNNRQNINGDIVKMDSSLVELLETNDKNTIEVAFDNLCFRNGKLSFDLVEYVKRHANN